MKGLAPGDRLGAFEVTRPLGRGAQASVWEVEHDGQRFAAKLLSPVLSQSPSYLRRFKREAASGTLVDHPNVARFEALVSLPDGRHFILMELLHGAPLSEIIAKQPLPVKAASEFAVQAAVGLGAIHAAGIVHRDVKPENLFIHRADDETQVKVIDFGIAKLFDSTELTRITSTGVMLGTPKYMSPEQISDAATVDHRCDIYALGVVLYRALAGVEPFDDDRLVFLLDAIQTEPPLDIREFRPDVPEPLAALIHLCLSKSPENRPPTMAALAAGIEAVTSAPTLSEGLVSGVRRDLVGVTLAQRLIVRRLLGEGGMGTVYEAEHTSLGRRVAVKVIHPEGASESLIKRFKREARITSAIDSPNVVRIIDFGHDADAGVLYLVMELVEGETLAEILARGPIPEPRLNGLFGQILDGVASAHTAGILHRDLKPQNIMVSGEEVRILDFGIGKLRRDNDKLTADGAVLGTPAYMSPEQCQGLPIDERTDLYALGVVLHEMVTGRLPYEGSATQMMMQHITGPVPNVSPKGKHADAITWLMAKTPEARCRTVRELQRLLAQDRAKIPVAREPSKVEMTNVPARPRARFNRNAVFLMIAALLGIALVALAGPVQDAVFTPRKGAALATVIEHVISTQHRQDPASLAKAEEALVEVGETLFPDEASEETPKHLDYKSREGELSIPAEVSFEDGRFGQSGRGVRIAGFRVGNVVAFVRPDVGGMAYVAVLSDVAKIQPVHPTELSVRPHRVLVIAAE